MAPILAAAPSRMMLPDQQVQLGGLVKLGETLRAAAIQSKLIGGSFNGKSSLRRLSSRRFFDFGLYALVFLLLRPNGT